MSTHARKSFDLVTPLPTVLPDRTDATDAFASSRLADAFALGAIGPHSVRVWLRTEADVVLDVELATASGRLLGRGRLEHERATSADHTRAFAVPEDVPGLPALEPDTAYRVRVLRSRGVLVGEGRFRTAPPHDATNQRVVFGIASCHQPFDDDGRVRLASSRMLTAAERALRAHDARFLLLVGDQIYADYPKSRSLFAPEFWKKVAPAGRESPTACTREEIRRLYHERHRIFFGVEGFARLQAGWPTYPMLDDHEIRDNFGSAPEDRSPEWSTLREGALDAFYDYQVSRVLPPGDGRRPRSFHYAFEHGPIAVFVADLRSSRTSDGDVMRVLGDAQLADLETFLARHVDKPVISVVLTVPLVHIESWMADAVTTLGGSGCDAADRWSHSQACGERDALLRMLHQHQRKHPAQKLLLLSGDIHVGSAMRLAWTDGVPPLYQLTSSALSHVQHPVTRWVAEQLPRTVRRVVCYDGITADVDLVPGEHGEDHNPFGGLNLGIVDVDCTEEPRVRFRLCGARRGGDEPVAVYTSQVL